MELVCRSGRVDLGGSRLEVGSCASFCREAVRLLAGISKKAFHTPDSWVFLLEGGMAEVEERLFLDVCRVNSSKEVIEYIIEQIRGPTEEGKRGGRSIGSRNTEEPP